MLGESTPTALSVCAYDPNAATLYALVEPDDSKSSATNGNGPVQSEEESKDGALPTTKALPGVL